MVKKIICIIMAVFMLLPVLSCAGNKDDTVNTTVLQNSETTVPVADTTSADVPSQVDETTAGETVSAPDLPDMNFSGKDFNMLCRTARLNQFYSEEQTGSKLGDAVYYRNKLVEEKYGVKINCIDVTDDGSGGKGSEFRSKVEASVLSGTHDYDVIAPDYYWGCETKGWLTDLKELPYFNFDKPWWWQGWNKCFDINDRLTSAVGWLTLDVVRSMEVCYFNKTLMESLGYGDIYDKVYDKQWTLEMMKKLSTDAAVGVDDPNNLSADYRYGTILHYMGLWSLMFGTGIKYATYKDDGSIELNMATEHNIKATEALTNWVHGNNTVYYCASGDIGHNLANNENPTVTAALFAGDHSLFYCYGLNAAEILSTTDLDFGILPPPLLDENQEDYYTTTFGTSYFAILRTNPDEQKEFASLILEALNCYAYTMVKDVYYEDILKYRYTSDERTAKMIDFVVDKTYIDFSHVTSNYTGDLRGSNLNAIVNKVSIATLWGGLKKASAKQLKNYMEGYEK